MKNPFKKECKADHYPDVTDAWEMQKFIDENCIEDGDLRVKEV
tara:strand:+ start:164 stop:292 length:129 start_codon:yes stop_codon:yes gene_type:complete